MSHHSWRKQKEQNQFFCKKTFITWESTISSSMCKMNPNLKSEMKTYLCYCSLSNIYQGYEFEFLLNTHSLFSLCDIMVIHVSFLFTNGSRNKTRYPKNKLGMRKQQGFLFFTFAILCIPTLIPFKYLESIKYLPYISTYVIKFSFNLIPRIIGFHNNHIHII